VETTKNNNTNNWPFNKKNYLLFGIGIIVIILGYVIMGTGEVNSFQSVKLAPVLLVIGYLVIIPLSIFYKD
jgi:hypothetical protein